MTESKTFEIVKKQELRDQRNFFAAPVEVPNLTLATKKRKPRRRIEEPRKSGLKAALAEAKKREARLRCAPGGRKITVDGEVQ
jgi:hypothetical protein